MILFNGVFHEGFRVPFDLRDRGLLLGDGLFETMPVFNGIAYLLDRHLDRLMNGLSLLGIPMTRERLHDDVLAIAKRAPAEGAVLRLTVTRGAGTRGLAPPSEPLPTVVLSLSPFDPKRVFAPARLASVSIRRNEHAPSSRLKSLGYLDHLLALQEAQAKGATDAIILNTAGRVACTTIANLMHVAEDRLETPPVREGVLAGIMRGRILELAKELEFQIFENEIESDVLKTKGLFFLTNSIRLVQPVAAIDGLEADPRTPSVALPILKAVLADIAAVCGRLAWSVD